MTPVGLPPLVDGLAVDALIADKGPAAMPSSLNSTRVA
jgi:hypothetical protein